MRPRTILITAVVIVLVIIGIAMWRSRDAVPETTNTTANSDTNANTATNPDTTTPTPTTGTGSPSTAPSPTASSSGGLKYDDALALYTGKLFQFRDCVAGPPPVISPGSLSIKQSTKYMLDNRHTEAHTIRVGTQSYRLSANSFVIATAPATRGTYNITCDGGGVAQLLVQP